MEKIKTVWKFPAQQRTTNRQERQLLAAVERPTAKNTQMPSGGARKQKQSRNGDAALAILMLSVSLWRRSIETSSGQSSQIINLVFIFENSSSILVFQDYSTFSRVKGRGTSASASGCWES